MQELLFYGLNHLDQYPLLFALQQYSGLKISTLINVFLSIIALRYFILAMVLFLFVFSVPSASLAGAWVMGKGTSKWMLSSEYTFATHLYDRRGKLIALPRYHMLYDTLYGEYGVTETLTVWGSTRFEQRKIGYPTQSAYSGLGYSEIGGRYRVWEGFNAIASVQVSALIPGARNNVNPVEWGQTDFQADARGLVGYSFSLFKRHFFTDLQIGYRARFGDPADELRIDATLGASVSRKLMVLLQSFNTLSIGTPKSFFTELQDYKIQISAVWDFNHRWALQAGTRTTLRGINTLQEQTYFGGLWLKF